jgi:tetratricopeptide (TPR) repeat protein
MRHSSLCIFTLTFFAALEISVVPLHAKNSAEKPFMLVTWFGPGTIQLPHEKNWKLEMLNVYDDDRRPVAQYSQSELQLVASFILFENLSGNPTAQGCRKDAIDPIIAHDAKSISNRVDGDAKNDAGETLATTSYLVDILGGHHQHHLFGFSGNDKTCAEIHISSVIETAAEDGAMKAALTAFHPDLTYQPKAYDYFLIATLLFKNSPALSIPYYESSLATMPNDPNYNTPRRIATDQLVMSLGMSGDIKSSRDVAEKAIAIDPDYPINYYNLACIDAEQGDATAAKLHLQQAFDRRSHALKGESMPDPTKDNSILKLKKNESFWSFVLALPKN